MYKFLFKLKYLYITLILLSIFLIPSLVKATTWINEDNIVNLYFFHSNECSHCNAEMKALKKLEKKYNNLNIYYYEVNDEKYLSTLEIANDIYKIKTSGVPITIIGEAVYLGYNENKSYQEFNKTIEYYSKYYYQDKLGEALGIDKLPFYKESNNNLSLEEYLDKNMGYTIIGNIKTTNLDYNVTAVILGALSGINPYFIISIIIVLIFLEIFIKNQRKKLLLVLNYLLSYFLLITINIININIYTLLIQIILLILFTLYLIKYTKTNMKEYIIASGGVLVSIVINFITKSYYLSYLKIFNNIKSDYLIEGIDIIIYYINYLMTYFLITIFMSLIISSLLKVVLNRIKKY